jgi:phosphocarrier protein HPr
MRNHSQSLSKDLIIANNLGLHARPAAEIAKLAKKARKGVWISNDLQTVDASSIIDILTMGCGMGSRITIKIDDSEDMAILDAIVELVETGFKEQMNNV